MPRNFYFSPDQTAGITLMCHPPGASFTTISVFYHTIAATLLL